MITFECPCNLNINGIHSAFTTDHIIVNRNPSPTKRSNGPDRYILNYSSHEEKNDRKF